MRTFILIGIFWAGVSAANAAPAADPGFQELAGYRVSDVARALREPGQPAFPQPGAAAPACPRPQVRIDAAGNIYNGRKLLGRGATGYKTGCTDDVAWTDRSGYLYRNSDRIGNGAGEYALAAFTGDVIWTDAYSYLYRNGARIGQSAVRHDINAFSGQVIWADVYGYLYRNDGLKTDRIGSGVREYKTAAFCPAVLWLDRFNGLYRNDGAATRRIGSDVKKYSVAARNGMAAWLDSHGALFVGGLPLARGVHDYSQDSWGNITWTDLNGGQHQN